MTLKKFYLEDIRKRAPCYDPVKYLYEKWEGTALDILDVEKCPPEDRIWVVLHTDCLHPVVIHRFMDYVIAQGKELVKQPTFKPSDELSQSEFKHLQEGKGEFHLWFKVWDLSGRKELIEKLKLLISEHEGENHEKVYGHDVSVPADIGPSTDNSDSTGGGSEPING